MTGIGRDGLHRSLRTVQGVRQVAFPRHPEVALELALKLGGLGLQLRPFLCPSQQATVEVALDLAQRDGVGGIRAVDMADRVFRVLPTLVASSAPWIFDIAVAVPVAIAL